MLRESKESLGEMAILPVRIFFSVWSYNSLPWTIYLPNARA